MQTTDHYSAAYLAKICAEKGIKHALISPGSRNAPLTIAFNRQEGITCISIPDERSAGFFALGMAQQLKEPVALLCTSGSALLNYGPAAAEAYYQYLPLLFITADRPVEWIDQGVGQTIQQEGALEPHVKATVQLPQDPEHADDRWHCQRAINEAVDMLSLGVQGPVHVNVPFREPLYGTTDWDWQDLKVIEQVTTRTELSEEDLAALSAAFNSAKKVLILAGQHDPSEELKPHLTKLVEEQHAVVLMESTSNLDGGPFFGCIDRLLPATDEEIHKPDLLISFGGPIISKRILQLLRTWKPEQHWRVGRAPRHLDTFQSLTKDIQAAPEDFFKQLLSASASKDSSYIDAWATLDSNSIERHKAFIGSAPYSDLSVFKVLLEKIPVGSNIHWANSTPIRYAQLFERDREHKHFANRGSSGIDGCTSTAAGFAHASGKLTTLVTGDVAFLYDTNGLWNHHLSNDFKIILIDNGGGNIFKYINGPDTTQELNEFFVTESSVDPARIAEAYGLEVLLSSTMDTLSAQVNALYATTGPALLCIKTDAQVSPQVLRDYFKTLANG